MTNNNMPERVYLLNGSTLSKIEGKCAEKGETGDNDWMALRWFALENLTEDDEDWREADDRNTMTGGELYLGDFCGLYAWDDEGSEFNVKTVFMNAYGVPVLDVWDEEDDVHASYML